MDSLAQVGVRKVKCRATIKNIYPLYRNNSADSDEKFAELLCRHAQDFSVIVGRLILIAVKCW